MSVHLPKPHGASSSPVRGNHAQVFWVFPPKFHIRGLDANHLQDFQTKPNETIGVGHFLKPSSFKPWKTPWVRRRPKGSRAKLIGPGSSAPRATRRRHQHRYVISSSKRLQNPLPPLILKQIKLCSIAYVPLLNLNLKACRLRPL